MEKVVSKGAFVAFVLLDTWCELRGWYWESDRV